MLPKALPWVWCTMRKRVQLLEGFGCCWRVHCVRGLLNAAWILYWLCMDHPAFSSWCVWIRLESGRQQLSCQPSPSLLLRCNFFNEENLLSRNITFLEGLSWQGSSSRQNCTSTSANISHSLQRLFSPHPPPPSNTPHSQTREWITLLLLNTSWQVMVLMREGHSFWVESSLCRLRNVIN